MANYIPLVFDKDTGKMVARSGGIIAGGARGWKHFQDTPATTWTINHNQNSDQLIVQVYDDSSVAEVTEVTVNDDASTMTSGDYWTLSTPLDDYFVWYNINSNGGAPDPGGTGIEVILDGSETTDQVAQATQAALDAESAFSATVSGSTVTVTNKTRGAVTDAANISANVSINVTTDGVTNPKEVIYPDSMTIVDRNTVELNFNQSQAGQAHVMFFTDMRDLE